MPYRHTIRKLDLYGIGAMIDFLCAFNRAIAGVRWRTYCMDITVGPG
jgi:hypothetical protein